ncbi:LytR/AlgR family response regulator transcription factor [Vibrio sp. TRT 17S01]|uniref:LytR/AlgR family response regulator transcription factor n=1 Tax=Vibrio sp. TRT 17S01 TaxID=3418505 RepID=UPI003CE71F55
MSKITAVIADDEPLLRHHLDKMLAELWPELEIVGLAANGAEAIELVQQYHPTVVFLDIRMPQLDGMSVAKQLSKMATAPLVVFITAYDEYAIQAFDNNAIDYLLKPVSEARLMTSLERIKARASSSSDANPDVSVLLEKLQSLSPSTSATEYLKWIRVQKGEDIHLVSVSDVLYFKAEDKYVTLYKSNMGKIEEFLLRASLKELLHQLDPEHFWQIHRSTVVNVSAVEKVKKEFTGKMYAYIQGNKLSVSRAMQSKFTHHW